MVVMLVADVIAILVVGVLVRVSALVMAVAASMSVIFVVDGIIYISLLAFVVFVMSTPRESAVVA